MRKIFTLAVSGMFLFLGCGEDKGSAGQESENKLGCITGKITIFNTRPCKWNFSMRGRA